MAIKKGDAANFTTLLRAAKEGDLGLLECKDAKTGEYRAVICAFSMDEHGATTMTPFGHMCLGNPFEDYIPPDGDAQGGADA